MRDYPLFILTVEPTHCEDTTRLFNLKSKEVTSAVKYGKDKFEEVIDEGDFKANEVMGFVFVNIKDNEYALLYARRWLRGIGYETLDISSMNRKGHIDYID